jgi:ABC-type amino acid transport substrate-binding protein
LGARLYRILISLLLFPLLSFAAIENHVSVATAVYRPFVILQEDGRLDGIYHEYVSELVKKAGLEARFETMPIQRVLNHAAKGTFDLFMFFSGIPEAKNNYIEIKQFHKLQAVIFSLDKKTDLKKDNITIGKPAGSICPVFSEEDEKRIKYFEFESIEQSVKLLTSKRINAICTTRERFQYEIQHSAHNNVKFYEIPEYHRELIVSLFANKHLQAEKLKSITKAAAELDHKKLINLLYKKYGIVE